MSALKESVTQVLIVVGSAALLCSPLWIAMLWSWARHPKGYGTRSHHSTNKENTQ